MTARGFLFGIYFYVITTLCVSLFLPALLLPRPNFLPFSRFWCRATLYGLRIIVNAKFEWRGEENIPQGGVIFASKHQSTWETVAFTLYLNQPAFILKQELMKIPLFGRYLKKIGCVAVDRSAGAKALKKMIDDTRQFLDSGRHIVIFPEGTRVKPGASAKFHPGVAALYRDTGYLIVPVALNSGNVWPKSIWSCRPGRIIVEYLPPVPTGLSRKELMPQLQEQINSKSDTLLSA